MVRPPAHDPRSPERRVSPALEPPHLHPAYRSTVLRAPSRPPLRIPYGPGELARLNAAALLDVGRTSALAADLTRQHAGEPIGERIIVEGQVLDGAGRPIAGALVEVWQANAAGRYAHAVDQHPAPLDPNFTGAGACITNEQGRYHFLTIKPGAYPWGNHANAWRPAHIHFSVIGNAFVERVVTQMYFPGDPLLENDPIYNALHDERARASLIGQLDLSATVPAFALAFHFDIVVGGRAYG
jgi:protocatechuate 3,4-dioxygenase beta subunit